MKLARKAFKPFKITPAKRGSGLSDVSENHDRYSVEGEMEAAKKAASVPKTTSPARPDNLVLRRCQFRQRKRTAAMQLLCTDAHFGAEPEFAAVSEARRSIPVNNRRIDATQKLPSIGFIARHDCVGMMRGIVIDAADGFIRIGHDANCNAQPQIFLIPVLLACRTNIQSAG